MSRLLAAAGRGLLAAAAVSAVAGTGTAAAEVVRVSVDSRRDVADGAAFALAGAYEAISGQLHFEVDPLARVNRAVADIEYAPTTADGRVEFSADFYMLKPKDPARGNGSLLFEVSNRGGKRMLAMLNRAAGSLKPVSARDVGDGFLLRNGFTLLWVGWQFDVPAEPDLLRVHVPSAVGVTGLVRSDFVVRERTDTQSLGDRTMIPYPAADPGSEMHVMTAREAPLAERRTVPRSTWRFARREGDVVVDDPTGVYLEGGFEPHHIYEVVYRSEDPPVAGLGLAAIRDAVSRIRYDDVPELGLERGDLSRAMAFGISQSGRLLRTFVYDGFNEDERQRIVFDGLIPHIAGGARGSFNHRFAQPSRASWSFFYPNALFPFADVQLDDGERSDGLLSRVPDAFRPKVFHTDSSNEYWRGSAALTHVDTEGRKDLDFPTDVRSYLFAGTQHVPTGFPPAASGGARHPGNPNDYNIFLRALVMRMHEWIADGIEPPPSRRPRLADGTLSTLAQLRFPDVPGVNMPVDVRPVRRIDHGDTFRTERVPIEPPAVGAPYPLLLPQVDRDGNEIGGLVSPELAAPLATYTGWNPYRPPFGPQGELVSLQGSYIAFARTRAEREAAGDPRPSIEERYPSPEHYLGIVARHAADLAEQGYLLGEDLPWIIAQAAERWRHAVGESAAPGAQHSAQNVALNPIE